MTRDVLFPEVAAVVDELVADFGAIDAARREDLAQLAEYVRTRVARGEPARLVFICTHNSRRSHLAQIWAQVAAAHYGVTPVETYSGGTEATAFAPPAVASVHRHGFRVEKSPGRENPRYAVRFGSAAAPLECWSKVYDEAPNPKSDFAAVMVCSSADAACPTVAGADLRVALPFVDPKEGDGRDDEAAIYDRRQREIAREMLFVFALVDAEA